jgi:glycosyltransferase involved in cell wall biosynthesis
MKVLYFHQYFSTPRGAGGTRSYEMARRLVGRGHEVTMVCGSSGSGDTGLAGEFIHGKRGGIVDGIKVIEFDLPYSNYDGFLKRSLTFIRFALRSILIAVTEKCDLVFATSTPLTTGIPGIAARVFRQKPFVFEVRDLWPELPKEMGVIRNPLVLGAMDLLEWLSYHCAKGCIGLSPGIVDGIKRRGIASENVIMIPNGCDLELFRVKESSRTRKEFKAIFTGAHGIANGLDAVLDAAEELKKRGRKDIRLLFIGDGRLKPALKERAVSEELDNCLFLDPIPKNKMPDLLLQVDVGMMILANVPAFYYGTSPNKFFDYIASGLPVINNYPGWLAGMITENKCGIAVPPEDPAAFADALEYMAEHPEEVAEMGKNARILAEGSFDRIQLAERFVDWLEQNAKE